MISSPMKRHLIMWINENKMKSKGVCIITSPSLLRASLPPLSNLVTVISSFTPELYVITGNSGKSLQSNNRVHVIAIDYDPGSTVVTKLAHFILAHANIVRSLVRLKNVDMCIFFMGERTLTLPLMASRMLRKKIIYMSSGSLIKSSGIHKTIFSEVIGILEHINHILSDTIILYSSKLIATDDYVKFKDKIVFAHEHFKDINTFNIRVPLGAREIRIGYIGRFSEEKGILNYLNALLILSKKHPNYKFLIGGNGVLENVVLNFIQRNGLGNRVEFVGWIPHEALPDYLNKLQLIVLPSYTEGLPNVMLEAMACGTPVLATPVGMIPEVITDGETGFIMGDNSPGCIAQNVTRALNSPNLEMIVENARQFVLDNFTFETTAARWRKILVELSWDESLGSFLDEQDVCEDM